ncbi:GATA transcription factor 8-like [Tasmannia lanceolata]|uniref:GATA transcription factor 8-like n=1 Tax=Tasmannia lanceolata TaxID=3420 RepID=UPI004062BB93
MVGPSFTEEIDTDICGDFFDHIEDLLDFTNEEVEGLVGGDEDVLGPVWPAAPVPDSGTGSGFSGHGNSQNSEEDLSAELSVPCEDIAQLEWLSNFVEDSFSSWKAEPDDSEKLNQKDSLFRSSSPVSVLESSSYSTKPIPLSSDTVIPGRARSKRPRPATFSPRPVPPLLSPTSSTSDLTPLPLPPLVPSNFETDVGASRKIMKINCQDRQNLDWTVQDPYSALETFAESQPPKKIRKKKPPTDRPPTSHQSRQSEHLPRKCMHCEIQKTPQWRAGPMGPKTLCNACGVRYKSGRLFPEYRPAASPTFVASLHSNSHKKVVEMRVKFGEKGPAPVPEFVRKSNTRPLLDSNGM